MQQLPKYKSHKIVQAVKILSIDYHAASIMIHPDHGAPFQLSAAFEKKHNPQPGGYFVVYDDNYLSYSPAEAFEAGYTLIEEPKNAMLVVRNSAVTGQSHLPDNYNELRVAAPKAPNCPYCDEQMIEMLIEDEDGAWLFAWGCSCDGVTAREG